jgi:hypothetical protein
LKLNQQTRPPPKLPEHKFGSPFQIFGFAGIKTKKPGKAFAVTGSSPELKKKKRAGKR